MEFYRDCTWGSIENAHGVIQRFHIGLYRDCTLSCAMGFYRDCTWDESTTPRLPQNESHFTNEKLCRGSLR